MAIDLIDKIKPKNNGTFAMADAEDIEFSNGKRLQDYQTKLESSSTIGFTEITTNNIEVLSDDKPTTEQIIESLQTRISNLESTVAVLSEKINTLENINR